MDRVHITLDLYGEYDTANRQLVGIWVAFPGRRRTPSLWRDIKVLVQLLEDHGKSDPEFTYATLSLLQPGQHIIYEDDVEDDALNPLGNPLEWEL